MGILPPGTESKMMPEQSEVFAYDSSPDKATHSGNRGAKLDEIEAWDNSQRLGRRADHSELDLNRVLDNSIMERTVDKTGEPNNATAIGNYTQNNISQLNLIQEA